LPVDGCVRVDDIYSELPKDVTSDLTPLVVIKQNCFLSIPKNVDEVYGIVFVFLSEVLNYYI